ncbi:hypothetical protein CONPUDRAFT_68160 [Coniophora puteana RWD-64-598 SS2]|uniref:Uncharacterized protein n=1 Tax=Coniophora puteana (strain RWD-64-598) TaxID=741705 RepID=R7SCP0_CONPW|nr:uncharacterized protein CONPUDRAFT_68160 [Coniophora puteana RWD-64-598 SS2]EIW73928.1 hypothetical protein CONPUDRAFT_68160 [Coniophora puteana RWD-64-598 SS2]
MVYSVPIIIFLDDVSGNISKQWNKHHAVYMSNGNLPREMLEKEFCIRYVSSSPHASPMDLLRGVRESVEEAARDGIEAYDCLYDKRVLLVPYIVFLAGDNPMQAEECSQSGLASNHFCRTCTVGGTQEFKHSDEGYNSLFETGEPRNKQATVECIEEQFDLALKSGAADKLQKNVQSNGTRDATTTAVLNAVVELGKSLRKRGKGSSRMTEAKVTEVLQDELERNLRGFSIRDSINPLLGIPTFDPHTDTPTEVLHTVLLGVVKYFWGQTAWLLNRDHLLERFRSRLDSLSADGLNAPNLSADYICRYRGGLIGKHFKSLAQVMPFLIYDLVPKAVLDAWTLIGELVVLIWHTKIDNTKVYTVSLINSKSMYILSSLFDL